MLEHTVVVNNELGKLIKKVRTEQQLNIATLAVKADASPSSISYAENGVRTLRFDTAQRVLKVLGYNKGEIKEIMRQYGYYDGKATGEVIVRNR